MNIDPALCEQAGMPASERMLARKPDWVRGNISPQDQPLLIGLTRLLRPRKVVEIGVASGWSGALFVDALADKGIDAEYIGIDYSPRYYLDPAYPTGAAIDELCPPGAVQRRLLLGHVAVDVLDQVGPGVDLAFIDGDHLHPWALLDLLTLLPVLAPGAYVLMHDLSLSTFERHRHTYRGPKYLFECWPGHKLHSSQVPPMIGALAMPARVEEPLINLLFDTLYTPWETAVDAGMLSRIAQALAAPLGAAWAARFDTAFSEMNQRAQAPAAQPTRDALVQGCLQLLGREADPGRQAQGLAHLAGLFPDQAGVWHRLSVARRAAGDLTASLQASQEALARAADAPHLLSFHGQVLLENGQAAEGEAFMRRAIALQGADATFHHRLALLLLQGQRRAEARVAALEALRLAPDRPAVRELAERLKDDAPRAERKV